MSISGYLIPFPDPGAADLMSDHLDEVVQSTGPGMILIRVSVPRTQQGMAGTQSGPSNGFARKRLELFQREGDAWKLLWGVDTDSDQEVEVTTWEIPSAGTIRCKLTNISGTHGQFALDCTYVPAEKP